MALTQCPPIPIWDYGPNCDVNVIYAARCVEETSSPIELIEIRPLNDLPQGYNHVLLGTFAFSPIVSASKAELAVLFPLLSHTTFPVLGYNNLFLNGLGEALCPDRGKKQVERTDWRGVGPLARARYANGSS